jgi:hypothetical protein
MNEVTLDYGDPNEMDTQDQGALMAEGDSRRRGEEEELDAEMEDWAKGYDGDMDAFEEVREQKLQELKNEKKQELIEVLLVRSRWKTSI